VALGGQAFPGISPSGTSRDADLQPSWCGGWLVLWSRKISVGNKMRVGKWFSNILRSLPFRRILPEIPLLLVSQLAQEDRYPTQGPRKKSFG